MPININCNGKNISVNGSYSIYNAIGKNTITASIDLWPKVLDQTRGYYNINPQSSSIISSSKSHKRMAIIVESPYKDEFDTNFNPLVPLNGI